MPLVVPAAFAVPFDNATHACVVGALVGQERQTGRPFLLFRGEVSDVEVEWFIADRAFGILWAAHGGRERGRECKPMVTKADVGLVGGLDGQRP